MSSDDKKEPAPTKEKKNVGGAQRRTWDIEEYERRAKERAETGDETVEGDMDSRPLRDREEFKKAAEGMAGPSGSARAFVKVRETNLNLNSAIGKTQIISDNGIRQKGGGWFCDVCDCLLKDTTTYLDHINGKKHQRALGFTMRVERSTVEQVTNRFEHIKKRKEAEEASGGGPSAAEAYAAKLALAANEENMRKRAKKVPDLSEKVIGAPLLTWAVDSLVAVCALGGKGSKEKRSGAAGDGRNG